MESPLGVPVEETALALAKDTAVIAMPRAAEVFGLTTIETELPANDNYLTRFALVEQIV